MAKSTLRVKYPRPDRFLDRVPPYDLSTLEIDLAFNIYGKGPCDETLIPAPLIDSLQSGILVSINPFPNEPLKLLKVLITDRDFFLRDAGELPRTPFLDVGGNILGLFRSLTRAGNSCCAGLYGTIRTRESGWTRARPEVAGPCFRQRRSSGRLQCSCVP